MVQQQTILSIYDKSKIKNVKCINMLKGSFSRYGKLNDLILVAVSNRYLLKKYVKQTMHHSLIIGTNVFYRRFSGFYVRMDQNRGVLLDMRNVLLSSRVHGPIPKESYLANEFRAFRIRGQIY